MNRNPGERGIALLGGTQVVAAAVVRDAGVEAAVAANRNKNPRSQEPKRDAGKPLSESPAVGGAPLVGVRFIAPFGVGEAGVEAAVATNRSWKTIREARREARTWASVMVAIGVIVAIGAAAGAQDLVIKDVTAHPVSAPAIENATILISKGRIAAIGTDIRVPAGVSVKDGRGLDAWPGFIDGFSQLGLTEIGSVPGSIDTTEMGEWNAHLRAAAAINPHSEHLPVARANGITTALVVPGGGLLPGTPVLLDILGRTVPSMEVPDAPPLLVLALPAPPARKYTADEAKTWDAEVEKGWKRIEEFLERARKFGAITAADRAADPGALPGQEMLALRACARHLDLKGRFLVRADTREHILAALAFAKKHGLGLVLAGLREGWKTTEALKAAGHPLLLGPPFPVPDRDEPYDAAYANAAALHRAGLTFGLLSGSSANVRNLPYQAAMMAAHGLPPEAALRALTLGGAEALGIAGSHGSLEPGKLADIVLWRGDPLDARADPESVLIRGRPVPRTTRHTRLAEPFLPR